MGTRSNRLGEAVLTSTHNLCFEQKSEKYQYFSSENFHFLVVRFSVYLNRHVFVMQSLTLNTYWTNSANDNLKMFFLVFQETICMKGQRLLSGLKQNNNIFHMLIFFPAC